MQSTPFGPVCDLGQQQFRLAGDLPFLQSAVFIFQNDIVQAPENRTSAITAHPLPVQVDIDVYVHSPSDGHGHVGGRNGLPQSGGGRNRGEEGHNDLQGSDGIGSRDHVRQVGGRGVIVGTLIDGIGDGVAYAACQQKISVLKFRIAVPGIAVLLQGILWPPQQWVYSAGARHLGQQGETQLFTGVENGPFGPWYVSSIAQPGTEIRIPHDQRKNRGSQTGGSGEGRVQQGSCQRGERPPHRGTFSPGKNSDGWD